jgi:hypothetical protein
MAEIKRKQQLNKVRNIIELILEEKEGYIQVYDLHIGKYYFIISKKFDCKIDSQNLYVGKVNHIEKGKYYFEDLHNPVTNEKFEDMYYDSKDVIYSKIEYNHFSFIDKYKMMLDSKSYCF